MQRCRDDNYKIKRLGQIFSGKRVGDLLVALLPDDPGIKSMIDPMAGRGDLLQAAYGRFSGAETIAGIDIDPEVTELCKKNLPDAQITQGDAFKSKNINLTHGWDLVITNPPYVRYQTLKSNPEVGLPDGSEIRKNLTEHIRHSMILDDDEKELYLDITKRYSGLSDMAVPSWILCASIVRQGGYMAMVVPETWLNRDYAVPIQYLLLRCFEILVVVRDAESAWFENAEVRTCLVIARRKKNEPLEKSLGKTVFLETGSAVIDGDSLVGRMQYDDKIGYEALNQVLSVKTAASGSGFTARIVPEPELFPGLMHELSTGAWIREDDRLDFVGNGLLPAEIGVLTGQCADLEYVSLSDLGWSVGQGLRTGANDFFYVQLISEEGLMPLVRTEGWYGRKIRIADGNLRKVLKKRSDVKGIVAGYDDLTKCIIYIQDQVRRKDCQRLSRAASEKYSVMDPELDGYISEGETYISPSHGKVFKELSAVKTNERQSEDGFDRFWYMLPPLRERHMPDLCMPRVCGGTPEVLFVNQREERRIVADANFITMWNPDPSARMRAFAILNSVWTKVFLEASGTAMGGGALKVEASHVRKLIFPRIESGKERELESLGERIVREKSISRELQDQIDAAVLSPFGDEVGAVLKRQLDHLLEKKLRERSGRSNQK